MKILLYRFEWEKINFLECDLVEWRIIVGAKEKIPLSSTSLRWEKYKKVLDEFLQLNTRYSPDLLAYQSPQKYRWAIKDSEWFALASLLHLFAYENNQTILDLNPVYVRGKLQIPQADFLEQFKKEQLVVSKEFKIAKTDLIIQWLAYLSLMKNLI